MYRILWEPYKKENKNILVIKGKEKTYKIRNKIGGKDNNVRWINHESP